MTVECIVSMNGKQRREGEGGQKLRNDGKRIKPGMLESAKYAGAVVPGVDDSCKVCCIFLILILDFSRDSGSIQPS